jgi:hypothetical protein
VAQAKKNFVSKWQVLSLYIKKRRKTELAQRNKTKTELLLLGARKETKTLKELKQLPRRAKGPNFTTTILKIYVGKNHCK